MAKIPTGHPWYSWGTM